MDRHTSSPRKQSASAVPKHYRVCLRLQQDVAREFGLARCPVLTTPKRVAAVFRDIARLDREVLIVGALDCKCRLLSWLLLAVGCSDRLAMRVGEAFGGALRCRASGIVLVHNHPSSSLEPSREDLALTREVAKAGRLLGYPLLDHVIVSRKGYRSLRRSAGRSVPDDHAHFAARVSRAAESPRTRGSRRKRVRRS